MVGVAERLARFHTGSNGPLALVKPGLGELAHNEGCSFLPDRWTDVVYPRNSAAVLLRGVMAASRWVKDRLKGLAVGLVGGGGRCRMERRAGAGTVLWLWVW